MADDYEGVPVGLGIEEKKVEEKKEAPAPAPAAPTPPPEPEKPSWYSRAARWGGGAAWAGARWGGRKAAGEAKAQLFSNVNLIGLVGFIITLYQAYNFFTGYGNYPVRIFGAVIIMFLLVFLRVPILLAVGIAVFDFVLADLIINTFIAKTPPFYLSFLKPIANLLPDLEGYAKRSITVLVALFSPSLVYVWLMIPIDESAKKAFYGFFRALYVILIVIFLGIFFISSMAMAGVDVAKTIANTATLTPEGQKAVKDAGIFVLNSPKIISEGVSNLWKEQINIATGGEYYAGQVEETKNKPVGVFIEDFKAADPEIYEGQRTVFWADIHAVTLADKNVTIHSSCRADSTKTGVTEGKIDHPDISIELVGTETVQCTFDKGLEQGSRTVNFSAEFDFTTDSYINAYFIERDRLVALSAEGKDPLQQYPVPTKNPVSVYTNGPIEIGMDLQSPIAVSTVQPMPILGVSLKPAWKGKVSKLKKVIIYVPDGILIDTDSCDHSIISTNEEPRTGYKEYKLSSLDPINQRIKDTPVQSFKCRLKANDFSVLKEGGRSVPLAAKYVFVNAQYDFELTTSQTVEVKENPEKAAESIAKT